MIKKKINEKYYIINCMITILAALLLLSLLTFYSQSSSNLAYRRNATQQANLNQSLDTEIGFAGGNGNESNPFLIQTAAQLDNVRNFASNILNIGSGYSYRSYHFRVICDIDMEAYLAEGGAGYAQWGVNGWLPIEKEGMFNGVFDGGFYTIKNLWSYRPDESYVGLFGYCEDSLIKNINLELSDKGIIGFAFVGGIAAKLYNQNTDVEAARITSCSVTGNVSAASGRNDWSVMAHAGGIVGEITNGAVMECVFSGNVSGLCAVGGIAGVNIRGKISDCLSYGKVVLTSTEDFISEAGAGGIVGISMGNEAIIKNCFYEAPQTDFRVAAIVGFRTTVYRKSDFNGLPFVSDCYYNSSVFSGSLTHIEDMEFFDEDTSCDGWYSVKIDEENYEWLFDENLVSEVWVKFIPINSRALTRAEIKDKSNFTGWDFEDTWGFDKQGNLVLRAFGNPYDAPSLAWLWIAISCIMGCMILASSYIIIIKKKKTIFVTETLIERIPIQMEAKSLPLELTEREKEIGQLILQGKLPQQIADELYISVGTVRNHIKHILVKCDCNSQKMLIIKYGAIAPKEEAYS